MAMTYSGLVADKSVNTSIPFRLNWSLLPMADIMTDAQAFIFSQLRVREMRASVILNVLKDEPTVPLPEGYLDPLGMFDEFGNEIHHWDERNMVRMRSYTGGSLNKGRPLVYSVLNELIQFDIRPDRAAPFTFLYYKRPPDLEAVTNETNWLTARYPHILRLVAMSYAYDARKEAGEAASYLQQGVALIQAANEEADLSRRGSDFPVEYTDGR